MRDAALWILQSKQPTASLSQQIQELLTFVEDKSHELTKLSEDCLFDLFCGFEPSEGESMLFLEAPLLRRCQLLPIDLVVDFLGARE